MGGARYRGAPPLAPHPLSADGAGALTGRSCNTGAAPLSEDWAEDVDLAERGSALVKRWGAYWLSAIARTSQHHKALAAE